MGKFKTMKDDILYLMTEKRRLIDRILDLEEDLKQTKEYVTRYPLYEIETACEHINAIKKYLKIRVEETLVEDEVVLRPKKKVYVAKKI